MGKVVVPDFETVQIPVEEAWKSGKNKNSKTEEAFEKHEQVEQGKFKEKVQMDVVSRPGLEVTEAPKKGKPKTMLESILEHKEEIMGEIESHQHEIDALEELGEKTVVPEVKQKLSRRRKKELKKQNELKLRREQQREELEKLNKQLHKEEEERRAIEKAEQHKLELEIEQKFLKLRSQYIQGTKREEEKITKSGDDLKMARLQELEKKRALEEKQKARRQQQRMRMESEFEKYHIEDRGSNIIGFKQKRKK